MSAGFNAKGLLDSLLAGGRDIAQRGEDFAAGQLGVGDDPQNRADLRKGALGGAAAAGALALLLGSKTGRKLGRKGLAVGGIALLGKLAYDKWTEHRSAQQAEAPPAPPVDRLEGAQAEDRARLLLTAMVSAAKADGHMDEDERALIQERLVALGPEASGFLFEQLGKPADAEAVASGARDPQSKAEVYAVSALVCAEQNADERAYLDRLAQELGIPAAEARGIEELLQEG